MRQDFSTTYKDFIGSIFQPWEMASYIRVVREQQLKIFSLPDRKISLCVLSLCAKWVKSCPKPVKNSTIWKKFSILERMQWAKKPSHATVPLRTLGSAASSWLSPDPSSGQVGVGKRCRLVSKSAKNDQVGGYGNFLVSRMDAAQLSVLRPPLRLCNWPDLKGQ